MHLYLPDTHERDVCLALICKGRNAELRKKTIVRADVVRRAMSKKKHKVMEQEREYFVNGLKNSDGTYACDG